MAKIKLTKNELKTQRDALKRFQRYLPTLQLKKQQLQMEMRKLDQAIHEKQREEERRVITYPVGLLFMRNLLILMHMLRLKPEDSVEILPV